MKIILWRVDAKGKVHEIDQRLWSRWILFAGVSTTTTQPMLLSAWAVKVLVFFVLWKMMRWIFDAFEIPILGSMANLVLIVLAFDQLLLSPLHSVDAWFNKINNFFSFLDADIEGAGIRERRDLILDTIWGLIKRAAMPSQERM